MEFFEKVVVLVVIPSTLYLEKISKRRWCLLKVGARQKSSFSYKRTGGSVKVNNSMKKIMANINFALVYQSRKKEINQWNRSIVNKNVLLIQNILVSLGEM